MAPITDDHDERALIEAAQADPACFVQLYERHFHRVYAYVIRRTGSRVEAEDITSEVVHRDAPWAFGGASGASHGYAVHSSARRTVVHRFPHACIQRS